MQTESHPLSSAGQVWATAELIAADSEVFGFPVGRLILAQHPPADGHIDNARESLRAWVEKTGAAIISASVPSSALPWNDALCSLNFACIDFSLQMTLEGMKQRPRPAMSVRLRLATPADHAAIGAIAATAFDFGRYHRDLHFPRALANKRFAEWMRRCLQRPSPRMRFLVLGPLGQPTAFMFLEVGDGQAQFCLGAVARDASNSPLGPMLFAGTLDALEAEGVRCVTGKISAANTRVMKIYSYLGFHASGPEFTFHWRNPASPHLLWGDKMQTPE
jgi:hypothetical protein